MAKIMEYKGIDGVRQITLNSLKTKGELRIYEIVYSSLNQMFSDKEAEELRSRFVKNNITIKELTNMPYKDMEYMTEGYEALTEIRYVGPETIKYETEVIIYNDTVAFYSYGKSSKGVEIIDKDFASIQKQIFDQIWKKGARPVIGKGGRSSLI